MRVVQKIGERGSQKWLQYLVNQAPHVIDDLILPRLEGASKISWQSPLVGDSFAEYRDFRFLKCIKAEHLAKDLARFWPERGPQWDGLARSDDTNDILLIEAKAHIRELCSPGTQASPTSRAKIDKALKQTADYVGAKPCAPWSAVFYQLANRLAHLYFLRKHGVKAWLVLINFVGAEDMQGPRSEAEWRAAYQVVWHVLGLREEHRLAPYVLEIFPRVEKSWEIRL